MFDKTMLNLLSLVIAAGGIISGLLKYNPTETMMSFYGKNLYLLKRNIIEAWKNGIFATVTLCGLAIRAISILSPHTPERIYPLQYYPGYSAVLIILAVVVFCILYRASILWGKTRSRRRLVPELKPAFENARDVIENRTEKKYDLEGILSRIEDLLDMHPATEDVEKRFTELKRFFIDT